jgi:murein DD-endopeptidase MepM/ murein hydrolase activator NlpD
MTGQPQHRRPRWAAPTVIGWVLLVLAPLTLRAQGDCPTVNAVNFPVDPDAYVIAQDYAARSPRHDGRYHTGEDWALPDGAAIGGTVRAIASGRVTYAYPLGWGRDGGVVILEHTFPDDSTAYSVYGHIREADGVNFPAGGACVERGTVLGVIGDARPVPHLHFEIRTENGSTPGAGYVTPYPDFIGYRRPSAFITDWAARFNPAARWVTTLRDPRGALASPLMLNDDSALVLTPGNVTRILPDGRAFWRTTLDRPAVAVTGAAGASLVHYTDGTIAQVTPDGALVEGWQVDIAPAGAPFPLDDLLVFPTANGRLAALDAARRTVVWEAGSVPTITEAHVAAQVIALRTPDHLLLTLGRANLQELDRAQLRPTSAVAANPNGGLLVYTRTGLWRVLADGVWDTAPHTAPPLSGSAGLAALPGGDLLLYDGAALSRLGADGTTRWQVALPGVRGRVQLTAIDDTALLLSTGGDVAVVDPFTGTCRLRLTAAAQDARLWHDLRANTLRVMVGPTFAALDWQRLNAGC